MNPRLPALVSSHRAHAAGPLEPGAPARIRETFAQAAVWVGLFLWAGWAAAVRQNALPMGGAWRAAARHMGAPACAMALVLLCAAAPVQAMGHGASFAPRMQGQCLNVAAMERHGLGPARHWLSSFSLEAQELLQSHTPLIAAADVSATPCESGSVPDPQDADASNNVCFEGVPLPVSTMSRLVAHWQAELLSRQVHAMAAQLAGRLGLAHGSQTPESLAISPADAHATRPPVALAAARGTALPSIPSEERSCTADPHQCESAPGYPSHMPLWSVMPANVPGDIVLGLRPVVLAAVGQVPRWPEAGCALPGHERLPERPPARLG